MIRLLAKARARAGTQGEALPPDGREALALGPTLRGEQGSHRVGLGLLLSEHY